MEGTTDPPDPVMPSMPLRLDQDVAPTLEFFRQVHDPLGVDQFLIADEGLIADQILDNCLKFIVCHPRLSLVKPHVPSSCADVVNSSLVERP